jgi:hypothetical protein
MTQVCWPGWHFIFGMNDSVSKYQIVFSICILLWYPIQKTGDWTRVLAKGLAVGVSDKIPTVLLIHTVKSGQSFGSDRGCYLKAL